MVITTEKFLNLLLNNREVLRISHSIKPESTNNLMLFNRSGVSRNQLLSHTQQLMEELRGSESFFESILPGVIFESQQEVSRDFVIYSDRGEGNWDQIFPHRTYPLLSKDENVVKVHLILS